MILCLDIGNTDIDAVVFCGNTRGEVFNIPYEKTMPAERYCENILNALKEQNIQPGSIKDCVLCSVVKSVTENLSAAVEAVFGRKPVMFRNDEICNMEILTDNPAEVGLDIVAGCYAVKEKYLLPAIVIDMGTATSVTAMNEKGAILGVSIITGTIKTLQALENSTGLPIDESLTPPARVIGTNTPDSIASGIVYGTACMMDGMIKMFEKEMGTACHVYATGGISKVIMPLCEKECVINPRLIMEAMYLYYRKTKNIFDL